MIWKTTAILSAGVLAAALTAPSSASAHAEDNALAFVIGAAVGHAISDHGSHVRKVHRRHPVHAPQVRYGKPYYHHGRPSYHHGKAYGQHKKSYHKKKSHHKGWHATRKHKSHERRYDRKYKRSHDRYGRYRGR
jgi:hypothetical protein